MEKKVKNKFLLKIVLLTVIVFGMGIYAAKFPSTMELLDKKAEEVINLAGINIRFKFFTDFSGFSVDVMNEILYWAELIGENIMGIYENTKSVPSSVISCAAFFPIKEGKITSFFGKRDDPISGESDIHTGTDIAAEKGTEVYCAWPGTVIENGYDNIYGNYVVVEHSKGFLTKYCHLSKICCEEGCFINAGEVIAKAGDTGRVTGSHLHFEIIIGGEQIPPEEWLCVC